MPNKPELLSPAGNFEKMKSAILYGADAVYLAGNDFGMRAAADNFSNDELKEAIKYAHERGVRIYITLNTMPHPDEYENLHEYLRFLSTTPPDAVICVDMGVIALVKKYLPRTEIHISTQASVVSAEAAIQWMRLGAKRVVLARELTFDEILKIRANIPDELELEAFIHGSMCISYSGRCLLSQHFTNRDANRGRCAQPCRWNFEVYEEKRPNDVLPLEQDKNGTFIMSSKDMCMIEHIPELVKSGITSFKIEGRMKSSYYTAVVTNTYRMAIDRYLSDPDGYVFDPLWSKELDSVSHREYATGFYYDRPLDDAKTCTTPGYLREKAYLAIAQDYDAQSGLALFIQRNKAVRGTSAEIISPGKCGRGLTLDEMFDENMTPLESAPHPFMKFYVKVPFEVKPGDIMRSGD
ncbi:MAG: U32 family peptidase [Ruminococcaceae bacterium]|nr:U32 family peptidase [Oscillospiraceae bacterium]